MLFTSVSDPHKFNADPDPTIFGGTEPDVDSDPDQKVPVPYWLNFFYLDLIFQLEKLCLFLLLTSKLFFKMPNFTMLDPDPYFWSNPDSGGQLHGDLDPKHWLYHLKSYRQ